MRTLQSTCRLTNKEVGKMKRMTLVSVVLCLVFSVGLILHAEAEYICKYAESWPVGSARINAAEIFKNIVETVSGGRIEVQVFPAGQLGTESETMDSVQLGVLQVTRGALFEKANRQLFIYGLPFLFTSFEEGLASLDAPISQAIMEGAKANGFYIPSLGLQPGRNVTNNVRPIETPSDMEGLLLRVPPIDLNTRVMTALGASTQLIPFTETYMAMKTGVVDGQENPVAQIVDMKFYEVQKYISFLEYTVGADPLYISLSWYESLPEDLQAIVTMAGELSGDYLNWAWLTQKTEQENFLRENMTANNISAENYPLFVDAVQPVWDYYINEAHYFTQAEVDELLDYVRGD